MVLDVSFYIARQKKFKIFYGLLFIIYLALVVSFVFWRSGQLLVGDYLHCALSKHALEFEHDIDFDNYEILDIETDFKRRKFILSFFINSEKDALNDRDSVSFPQMYRNLQQN